VADLNTILKNFSPYDYNHDEIFEINSLAAMDSSIPQKPLDDKDKLLLIIVNLDLLKAAPEKYSKYLKSDLETFRYDL